MTVGELRFDGRVALITGAGGQQPNLGVAYAKLLASRGAKVVVNDLGVGPDGTGSLPANAEAIVKEILDAGGEAIGDTHSVAEPASAKAVVQTALDAWGRLDILVNNAGVVMFALFDEISDDDVRRIVDTHLLGHIWMTRAALPHMCAAGYGRIVNISSRAAFANPYLTVYGAAKAGIIGLTNNLAFEAGRHGIKVNAVAPEARTRKHPYMMDRDPDEMFPGNEGEVNQVAPVVAYLCHEQCQPNGALFWVSRGKVVEYRTYESAGYYNPELTIEDIQANLEQIRDQAAATEYMFQVGPEILDTMPRRAYVPR
jgi:NAD(P)-dependent dehydrogenase (short-subunit alcohol dehydrogenase family)